jgi:GNAT superfamily N-acetyltransferase
MSLEKDGTPRVLRMGRDDVARVVDVICDAFRDYPVMRYVLGEKNPDRGRHLQTMVNFFVMSRVLRDEPVLGVMEGAELGAAAIASFPENEESPQELHALREKVWEELGVAARGRYERCGEVWKPLSVDVPNVHLNVIGVRQESQGRGLGRLLLDYVHDLSRRRPASQGVTLTTEVASNVGLYEHMGYEVVGHARISPELETWSMFRPD